MKLLIAGDFVPRCRIATKIEQEDFTFLEEVQSLIRSVDYSIVNLESPVVIRESKPIEKTGPSLCCTDKAIECISHAGFNCVTLANNHFRDYGQTGVEDTINTCQKYGIDYVGGGRTQSEAKRTLFVCVGGETVAIINACEHEWSIASEDCGGSNLLDVITICHSIRIAKQQADYVLLIIHGGTEHYNLPTPRMKYTYRFFVEQGADAVINHHQHCYSGYEMYHNKPIIYGIGNFCFDKPVPGDDKSWEEGYLVKIQLADSICISLHPFVQCDENRAFVHLKSNQEEFLDTILRLNEIISDDKQLNDSFNRLAKNGSDILYSLLAPYSSSFMQSLFSKKVLPSFVTKNRLMRLLAFIQCDSHRDILLTGLKQLLK